MCTSELCVVGLQNGICLDLTRAATVSISLPLRVLRLQELVWNTHGRSSIVLERRGCRGRARSQHSCGNVRLRFNIKQSSPLLQSRGGETVRSRSSFSAHFYGPTADEQFPSGCPILVFLPIPEKCGGLIWVVKGCCRSACAAASTAPPISEDLAQPRIILSLPNCELRLSPSKRVRKASLK